MKTISNPRFSSPNPRTFFPMQFPRTKRYLVFCPSPYRKCSRTDGYQPPFIQRRFPDPYVGNRADNSLAAWADWFSPLPSIRKSPAHDAQKGGSGPKSLPHSPSRPRPPLPLPASLGLKLQVTLPTDIRSSVHHGRTQKPDHRGRVPSSVSAPDHLYHQDQTHDLPRRPSGHRFPHGGALERSQLRRQRSSLTNRFEHRLLRAREQRPKRLRHRVFRLRFRRGVSLRLCQGTLGLQIEVR